jgi:hypothetical protein
MTSWPKEELRQIVSEDDLDAVRHHAGRVAECRFQRDGSRLNTTLPDAEWVEC